MLGRLRILAVVMMAMSVLTFASAAEAAGWLEKNFALFGPRYSGKLPPCDYPLALSKIQYLFGVKERRFWNSALAISAFEQVREISFRPWAPDTIPRRYCAALHKLVAWFGRPRVRVFLVLAEIYPCFSL